MPAEVSYDGSLIDAVRITLERQSSIAISRQQVAAGDGALLSAQGVFDPTLNAGTSAQRTNTPVSSVYPVAGLVPPYSHISEITADASSYQAGLTRKLRSGITVNAAIDVTHTLDNYSNFNSPSYANVGLNFTLPLLRGRGEEVTTANERAALLNRDAAVQNSRQAVATAIATTVLAYWNHLAAKETLDIITAAEARAQNLLNDARKLADANIISRLDVRKFESRLPSETAARVGAEQAVVDARGTLALAMGLRGGEIGAMAVPRDTFELIECCDIDAGTVREVASRFATAAQQRRGDVLSLDTSLRAAELLLVTANDAKKSQLDLLISVGYSGLNDRRLGSPTPFPLTALGTNVRGGNAFVGLNYSFPVNHHAAQGLVVQQSALLAQTQLQKQALEDNIASSVEVSLNGLLNAAEQLKQARTALEIQKEVYDAEHKKYRYGLSTLLDLFTNEAQMVTDQLSLVDTQLSMAGALINLRLQTGTLLGPDGEPQTLDTSRLVTLPKLAGTQELKP